MPNSYTVPACGPRSSDWWILEGALLDCLAYYAQRDHVPVSRLAADGEPVAQAMAHLFNALRVQSGHSLSGIQDRFHSAWPA